MLSLNVATNAKQIAREFGDLSDDKVRRAVSSAINRAVRTMRTKAVAEIKKVYAVTPKELNTRAFTIRRASPMRLIGELKLTGERLRLMAFKARQTASGVSVAVRKSVRKVIPHAFIARMPNDHRGVFSRARYVRGKAGRRMKNKNREAIYERYTISVPEMLGKKQILEIVSKIAIDKFEERLLHELRFRSGK